MRKVIIAPFLFIMVFSSCRMNSSSMGGAHEIVPVDPALMVPKPCMAGNPSACVGEITSPVNRPNICPDVTIDPTGIEDHSFPAIQASDTKYQWRSEYTKAFDEATKWGDSPAEYLLSDSAFRDSDLEKLNCPGFKTATRDERRVIVLNIVAALSKKESGYETNQDTYECDGPYRLWGDLYHKYKKKKSLSLPTMEKMAAKELNVRSCWVSSGLFQMTRSTVENAPYNCDFQADGQDALHNPDDNIKCALRVLSWETKKIGGLFCTEANCRSHMYFGPLRRSEDSQDIANSFKKQLDSMPFCTASYHLDHPRNADEKLSYRYGGSDRSNLCSSINNKSRSASITIAKSDSEQEIKPVDPREALSE